MNQNGDNPITKKFFEKTLEKRLEKALTEHSKSIIEAVNFGFEKNEKEHEEIRKELGENSEDIKSIKGKLWSLESRIIYIEDAITNHSKILDNHTKELKEIKNILKKLQKQEKIKMEKIISLEQRVGRLEAYVLK